MDAFLAAVRNACPVGLWSQGVRLAREGAVSSITRKGSELEARVREKGRAVSPTVLLYVDDEEWDCDCGGKVSPCAHVAAVAIVAAKGDEAPQEGAAADEAKPGAAPAPRAREVHGLRYLLSIEHGALQLRRELEGPSGVATPLTLSLTDRIARGIAEPPIEPTHDDLRVDRLFPKRPHGDVPLQFLGDFLEALVHASSVSFEGAPVRCSPEPIEPDAVLVDGPKGGVTLELSMPRGASVVALGVGRVGDTLRPLAQIDRYGARFERLPIRRVFAPAELGTLVGQVLPELEKRGLVEVRTRRLPSRDARATARLSFDVVHEGHGVSVMPLLVYGDPPTARVDAGKLVLLAPPAPVRDEARERALLDRLRDELSLVPGRPVKYLGREAAAFIDKLERFRHAVEGRRPEERPELVAAMHRDGDRVVVRFELAREASGDEVGGGGEAAPTRGVGLAQAMEAWRSGLGLVALDDGSFAKLPAAFLQKHAQALFDLVAVSNDDGSVPPAAVPVLAEVADSLGLGRPPIAEKLAPLAEGFEGIPEAALPADLRAELRPYQRRGIDWLSFLREASLGGLLADDMGLGKTLQTLAALRGRSLVVCPRSVVHNWAAELARFRPGLRVARYDGPSRKLDPEADVTLLTYGILLRDVDLLRKTTWEVVVLDEAQAIKNPDSQAARAACALEAKARFALTGTPVENRLEELWSLMRFACPGLLGPRADFVERYAKRIEAGEAGVAERLRARIRPFVLRRHKSEVLRDLPPRSESTDYVELDETEREAYELVRAATKREVVEKLAEGANVLAVLEALLRLRQAACHRGLLPGQEAASSSKVERVLDIVEELASEGHRALVFSQWTSLLDKVEPGLESRGLGYLRLDGQTRDRESVVNAFQAEAGPPVLLLSLKAGGTGLNLTAADHVFLLDPWWNPAVEEQAADRAHRIGQDRPVLVHRIVAKDTVEEGILALQEKKRALAQAAVGDASGAAQITRDDLLALLEA